MRNSDHPFSDSVRTYLEEACITITYKTEEIRDSVNGVRIPGYLEQMLSRENSENEERLKRKLTRLCNSSKWNDLERIELTTNISSRRLTRMEMQALSLRLKFDVGGDKKIRGLFSHQLQTQ